MKLKKNFIVRAIAGKQIAMPFGTGVAEMIELNDSGRFLWDLLKDETSVPALTQALMTEYEGLDAVQAETDVKTFLNQLREADALEGTIEGLD